MADHTEPELQLAADSLMARSSPDTRALCNPENSAPMLDVHAPHESIHTWKSFFIHIATIVIGLFIAVGLEQTAIDPGLFNHLGVVPPTKKKITPSWSP